MIEQFSAMFGPAAQVVSRVLVHSLWQGGLIASTLAVTVVFLRRSSAQLRYALSCLAMVSIVMMSVLTGVYIGFGDGTMTASATVEKTGRSSTGLSGAVVPDVDEGGAPSSGLFIRDDWLQSVLPVGWFFSFWVLGVLALSLYHALGWRKVKKLIRHGTADAGAEWSRRFMQLCRQLKIDRAVRLAGSTLVRVPCVVGWLKPVILVPLSSFTGLATKELELILLHELAHIRRHDVLVGYIQTVVETLFFFNPAVWWISRRIRMEREHCCDDAAVACSGDRLSYARALANLEELRAVGTNFAAAAAGTPLRHRVCRLLGTSTRGPAGRLGVAGAVLMTALMVLGIGWIGASAFSDVRPGTTVESAGAFEPGRDDIHGEWEIETEGRDAQVRIRFGRDWQVGFSIRTDELPAGIGVTTRHFQMRRDAGTFHFVGDYERTEDGLCGEGDCYFRPNPEYVKEMGRLGFDIGSDRDILKLAIHNVTFDFVRGLHDLGYDDLTLERLIEARIHDVTPEFIRELGDLGYRDLKMNRLVEMQIHDVEPEFIRDLAQLGYENIPAERLVEMRIHDVSPDFIAELAELGYDGLETSRLIEMQIHDVSPSYIRRLADLGYRKVEPATLVEMKIHDVTPRYISRLAELGYADVSPDLLIEMRIHDVTPSFIRKLKQRGIDDLSPRELIDYKIHRR